MADPDYEALRTAFTASVSHELRTPLARLQALLESAELPGADLQALLAQARLYLETARDEMQTYFDERSPTWQEGERATILQDHLEQLDALITDLDALSPF